VEGNQLDQIDSQSIWDRLNNSNDYNLSDIVDREELPVPKSLSDKPDIQVIEIRNHLLATYYLYHVLLKSKWEINIDDIKKLHRIIMKDTPFEKIEMWGRVQESGTYRCLPIRARGYPLTVYPVSLVYFFCFWNSIMTYFIFSKVSKRSTRVDGQVHTFSR
jgi:hypothetical protein